MSDLRRDEGFYLELFDVVYPKNYKCTIKLKVADMENNHWKLKIFVLQQVVGIGDIIHLLPTQNYVCKCNPFKLALFFWFPCKPSFYRLISFSNSV